MASLPIWLAWAVIVSVPVHWFGVFLLRRLLRTRRGNRVLRDRFLIAGGVATVVTVFAVVFINNDLTPPPPLSPLATQILTRTSILFLVGPVLYWLWLYRGPRVDPVREATQDTVDADRELKRDADDAAREERRNVADAERTEAHEAADAAHEADRPPDDLAVKVMIVNPDPLPVDQIEKASDKETDGGAA